MTLAAWILLIAVPVAKQVLVGLGIGFVTYAGISTLLDSAVSSVQTNFTGMGGDMLGLIQLSGSIEAIGIMMGGISARLLMMSLTKFRLSGGAV